MQKLAIALALTAALPAAALAQSNDIKANKPYSAYVQDSSGNIVKSGSGLCWHTNYWTPADAVIGCDGELVPPIANPIAPPMVAASAPLVPAPPPPAPPKACDFSFVLKADETFTFNYAKLSQAAKHGLDTDFRNKLGACATVQRIVVTGYTDRLGGDAYNQKLSQKRAEAVADYLKSIGVAGAIEQRGMGKANEIEPCTGVKGEKKLIQCLAPNRRVTIDVHGTAK
ncbi:MAG TPA: OmpA family protein [Burkholderiaceae bacterium]